MRDAGGVNYSGRGKTEGPGYNCDKTLGINLRACLAATTDGVTLGLLDQSSHTRPERKDESATHDAKKRRKIEEKESYRWLETTENSVEGMPSNINSDREGDMYELFEKASTTGRLFLIRIVQNRMTTDDKKIVDEIKKTAPQGLIKATQGLEQKCQGEGSDS